VSVKLQMNRELRDHYVDQCGFTDDEVTVLDLKRRGWFNEDIAAEMYCSSSTIKRRVRSIKNKINSI
jgi:DNA-binding NarL/FixJ family response regulator